MLSRVGLVLALWLTLAGAAQAADVHVTRADDRPAGTCGVDGCTLREALAVAQNGDTVRLGTGVRRLEQGTLEVTRSITIAGLVADVSSIDGSTNQRRILHVHAGATVTLRDLSLQGGRTGFEGPDPLAVDGGGALYNEGSTTVEDVVFAANGFSAAGGAISNRGTLTLTDVDLRGNVGGFGGGLFVHGGTVTVNRSTFRESTGNNGGAAVYVRGGTVELVNASVLGNGEFGQGGGLVNAGGALTLRNVTLAGNVNGSLLTTSGTTSVGNSILGRGHNDACGPDAITTDLGRNLDEDASCGVGTVGDARLAPVADNGGGTPTAALLAGSAAIDAGAGCPATDQREIARIDACDIGAFEAVKNAAPAVETLEARDGAFHATADVKGEGGKLFFEYGTDPGDLEPTSGVGVGAPNGPVTREEAFPPLQPGTTYHYRAVAVNASGTATGALRTLTTPRRPSITQLSSLDVGDDSVTLRFTIDPGGADAAYRVLVDGDETPLLPVPGPGPRTITRTITGLTPGTEHRLQIVASNASGQTGLDDAIIDRRTLTRFTGTAGVEMTVGADCTGTTVVDWGDGTTSTEACGTAAHTYVAGGRYRVAFAAGGEVVARVDPAPGRRLLSVSVRGAGRVTGNGIDCPRVCNVELPPSTAVSLTATGQDFQGWADACQGTGACAFELSEHRHVVADFGGVAAPPAVGEVHVGERTDTTARIGFLLDANGAPTTYRLVVNGTALAPVAAGSGEDAVALVHDLSGLAPGTRYDVQVVVSNDLGEVSDGVGFSTFERVHGRTGEPTRLVLTGTASVCPGPAQIDWGDETVSEAAATCTGQAYRVEATHTYARADRYRITVRYDAGPEDTAFAVITAPPPVVAPDPTPVPTAVPTASATPTPTPTPVPVPAPTAAVDVVATPAGGTVLVKLPGSKRFVMLRPGQELPYGTEIDTRKGRVTLTAVPRPGAPAESAVFSGGRFKLSYAGGITNLTLSEPLAPCKKAKRATASAKKAKSRKLWGKGKGAFRTTGRYSSATVRGTTWLVQDTCAGTLTRVTEGAVTVRHGRKTILVRAGRRYLAKPR